jgi:hypothetical protein
VKIVNPSRRAKGFRSQRAIAAILTERRHRHKAAKTAAVGGRLPPEFWVLCGLCGLCGSDRDEKGSAASVASAASADQSV